MRMSNLLIAILIIISFYIGSNLSNKTDEQLRTEKIKVEKEMYEKDISKIIDSLKLVVIDSLRGKNDQDLTRIVDEQLKQSKKEENGKYDTAISILFILFVILVIVITA